MMKFVGIKEQISASTKTIVIEDSFALNHMFPRIRSKVINASRNLPSGAKYTSNFATILCTPSLMRYNCVMILLRTFSLACEGCYSTFSSFSSLYYSELHR